MAWRDTPFSTGAKDKLAKADVYNEKRDSAINNKADKINNNVDLLDRLKNDPKYLQSQLDLLKNKKTKSILDSNKLLSRLSKLLGGDYSLIANLLPVELAVLYKLYQTKDDRHQYRTNGSSRLYTTDQIDAYNRANILLDTVAPIVPEPDPDDPEPEPDPRINTSSDITSQVAVLTTAITTFSDLRDPDSIANAIARITDPEVRREVYFAILEALIRSSDLLNLSNAVDELGAEALLARRPNIIAELLGAFEIPENVTSKDYPELQTKLLTLLTKINPYWYLTVRADTTIRNLKPYILMSDDAKTIIETSSLHKAACMISDSYRESNIVDTARAYFPTAPI